MTTIGVPLTPPVIVAVITILGFVYGAGKRAAAYREHKEDVVIGHRVIHDDLREIDKEINSGDAITDVADCPVCPKAES